MPYSFLIFDFGDNEEAARKARLAIEGWKQAFRLDRKLLLKFDSGDAGEPDLPEGKSAAKRKEKGKKKEKRKERLRLMVRLDFSDHERLSHQRWLDRIPAEPLFRDAHPKVIRQGDPDFSEAASRFDLLD